MQVRVGRGSLQRELPVPDMREASASLRSVSVTPDSHRNSAWSESPDRAWSRLHDDAVKRHAVRLLKYRAVRVSESSHNVAFTRRTRSSNAVKFPFGSRLEISEV